MKQLKQWKAKKADITQKSKEKPQESEQGATKSKTKSKLYLNPLALKYTQLTRQFQLIQDSNKRCLEIFPDEFHHKIKFHDEITDLVNKLAGGGNLLNTLAKTGNLSQEHTDKLKGFNQANKYLIYKFSEVVEQIQTLKSERTNLLKEGD